MAKKSMLAREVKRAKLVQRDAAKRKVLRAMAADENASYDDRWAVMIALQKLPRDGSPSRRRNRCALSGRPRGYYRRFGLGRNKLREVIMSGDAPGVVKASW
ncbi:MAG: 30S ribosomal protein S14 [Pseudomonadota bacterium]|nr:30S ribosomal protein S14 [Pseudomonadota bacterium]